MKNLLLLTILVTSGCYIFRTENEINKYCAGQMAEVTTKFGDPVAKRWMNVMNTHITWYYLPVTNSTQFVEVHFIVSDATTPPTCVVN